MYEYKIVAIKGSGSPDKIAVKKEAVVNDLASAGWRLTLVEGLLYIFEREK